MRLLVIDGNSIANRAFFGIKLLTTKDGRYTNAIFGFLNIMLSLLKESQPDEVAVAFDLKAPTFRHKMYEGYKATRHGMPDELAQQMPVLKEILTDLGYRIVTAEGWEADDILGTLAAACAARQDDCFLATGQPTRAAYGRYENVFLSQSELDGLKADLPDKWNYYIDRLSCHIASSGKRYKSHAATIYKWAQEDAAKKAPKKGIPDYSCKEGESL